MTNPKRSSEETPTSAEMSTRSPAGNVVGCQLGRPEAAAPDAPLVPIADAPYWLRFAQNVVALVTNTPRPHLIIWTTGLAIALVFASC